MGGAEAVRRSRRKQRQQTEGGVAIDARRPSQERAARGMRVAASVRWRRRAAEPPRGAGRSMNGPDGSGGSWRSC
jgi:hypothetical protein